MTTETLARFGSSIIRHASPGGLGANNSQCMASYVVVLARNHVFEMQAEGSEWIRIYNVKLLSRLLLP